VTRFSRHDESAKTIEKPKTTLDTATKSQVDGHRDAVSDTATRPAVSPRRTHPTEPSNAKPPPSQIAENRPIPNTADPPPVAHSSAPAHSDQENVELAPRAMKIAESGDCKTALPLLETAVSANPSNVNLILVLGRCQNALGKFSEASQSLTSAIEMSGNRADLYAERAKSFFGRNQFRPALSDVDQALKYQPGNPAAVELRGDIFMQKGPDDDAVNAYYDVYQRAPTRGLCSKLAQAYLKNGAENSATRLEEACRQ
jgi:predicted Zn-dependent protease